MWKVAVWRAIGSTCGQTGSDDGWVIEALQMSKYLVAIYKGVFNTHIYQNTSQSVNPLKLCKSVNNSDRACKTPPPSPK